MTAPARRIPPYAIALIAALVVPLALAGCAAKPKSELAATAEPAAKPDDKPDARPGDDKAQDKKQDKKDAKPAAAREADDDPGPPLMRHEAAGQCWMIADKRGGSIEAKTKIVDKCIDDKLKADAGKRR